MKIRYISDIHIEFHKPHKVEKFIQKIPSGLNEDHILSEICILAGDIGNPYQKSYDLFMEYISKNFKKVFYITGNHEYYSYKNNRYTIEETNSYLVEYFKKFNNITFLNNTYEIYEGYCFIGTTLWSHISNRACCINDVYEIPELTITKYNKLHEECKQFLKEAIANANAANKNTKCIVITHHCPTYNVINEKYKILRMMPYNQWFASDIFESISLENKKKIKCWFYGHTHTPSHMIIDNIDILCNSIGYPNENSSTNFNKTYCLS